jgi:hypothetical protein
MCRRSVLALPSSEKAKRGRFAYTASRLGSGSPGRTPNAFGALCAFLTGA